MEIKLWTNDTTQEGTNSEMAKEWCVHEWKHGANCLTLHRITYASIKTFLGYPWSASAAIGPIDIDMFDSLTSNQPQNHSIMATTII